MEQHSARRWLIRGGIAASLSVLALLLLVGAPLAQQRPLLDDFDHLRTGFPLTGSHERARCESCHVGGMFEGTPRQCGTCHSGGGFWQATRKTPNHIPSTELCGDCHLTTSWAAARFDHSQVTADCIRCHNGSTATGKHANHVPSVNECQFCHDTTAWVPARFDHSMVTGTCYSCHNGGFATGKPRDHPPSSNECEICHDTRSWETSGSFDHAGITTGCFDCHNGGRAPGKPGNHPPSSNACETCHSTVSWGGAGFDHTGVTSGCRGCHATDTPSGHFVTTQECNTCHNTSGWLPASFRHSSAAYPDHGSRLDCTDCHRGGSEAVNYSSPAYRPDCAACHANDFKRDAHKKVDGPTIFYTVSELRDCTGACHQYTDATFSTIEKTRNGEHRPNRGDW
jgi:hypothetical protein